MDKSVHSPEYQTFLRELKRARLSSGLSQAELAERLCEPQSWVSRVETGETRMHLIEFMAYCRAIELKPADFLTVLEEALSK